MKHLVLLTVEAAVDSAFTVIGADVEGSGPRAG